MSPPHTDELPDRSGKGHGRYVLVFLTLFLSGLVFCVWANSLLDDYRSTPIDFSTMGGDERVIVKGLTRQQVGDLKIGFLERATPRDIGIFGNHQIQYWPSESFEKAGFEGTAFNYWFANLALPDLLDYLLFAERVGRLPNRAIVVQMTTPNNDNGQYIADRSQELPLDIQAPGGGGGEWLRKLDNVRLWMAKTFNYSTFLIGLFRSGESSRVVTLGACGDQAPPDWHRHVPAMLSSVLAMASDRAVICSPESFKGALMADGSTTQAGLPALPILNQNPLDPERLALNQGDSTRIAEIMTKLVALAERNGKKILFVIPPVFEDERYSAANRIVDRALEKFPDDIIIDHRQRRIPKDHYINYDHPNYRYFDILSREILERL